MLITNPLSGRWLKKEWIMYLLLSPYSRKKMLYIYIERDIRSHVDRSRWTGRLHSSRIRRGLYHFDFDQRHFLDRNCSYSWIHTNWNCANWRCKISLAETLLRLHYIIFSDYTATSCNLKKHLRNWVFFFSPVGHLRVTKKKLQRAPFLSAVN